ncbi:hypothetical protein EVAR_17047_1 [Eumeta japonica]|uniref:Uncharacterized protein n=1 Tax=Eumeta variegata TaxID=151549 RepID=A0A4C1V5D4_EUMVA|nr:hypothetical protein EVAR_17047_1 [Eumeta japonica]
MTIGHFRTEKRRVAGSDDCGFFRPLSRSRSTLSRRLCVGDTAASDKCGRNLGKPNSVHMQVRAANGTIYPQLLYGAFYRRRPALRVDGISQIGSWHEFLPRLSLIRQRKCAPTVQRTKLWRYELSENYVAGCRQRNRRETEASSNTLEVLKKRGKSGRIINRWCKAIVVPLYKGIRVRAWALTTTVMEMYGVGFGVRPGGRPAQSSLPHADVSSTSIWRALRRRRDNAECGLLE